MEADFTKNSYGKFTLRGGGINLTLNLARFTLGREDKGFSEQATELTLEAENAWTNCGASEPTDFAVYYDDLRFARAG